MPKGDKHNKRKLLADADEVIRRLLDGEATVTGIMREYRVAHCTLMAVYEAHATPQQRAAARHGQLARAGRRYRFKKGHRPWNKGLAGWRPPGAEKGWFKPGQMRGAAARNWRPIGTVTIRHDSPPKRRRGRKRKAGMPPWGQGRRFIKVRDDGRPQDRWVPLAVFLWQRRHGPVPKGCCVVHLDGDTLNDDQANLGLIHRRKLLAFQHRLNPGIAERRRAASSKVNTLRHATNREFRRRHGRPSVQWDCPACGAVFDQGDRPDRCSKCGSYTLEKISMPTRPAASAAGG